MRDSEARTVCRASLHYRANSTWPSQGARFHRRLLLHAATTETSAAIARARDRGPQCSIPLHCHALSAMRAGKDALRRPYRLARLCRCQTGGQGAKGKLRRPKPLLARTPNVREQSRLLLQQRPLFETEHRYPPSVSTATLCGICQPQQVSEPRRPYCWINVGDPLPALPANRFLTASNSPTRDTRSWCQPCQPARRDDRGYPAGNARLVAT